MNLSRKIVILAFITLSAISAQAQNKSSWVYPDAAGKLVYKTTAKGDRIMDFSFAGYMGGGVAIPTVPVKITLNPTDGDNTDAIQKAIDQVGKMPVVNGFCGAVLLNKGTYNCERGLTLAISGVVLRGSDGTTINMTDSPHLCIAMKGNPSVKTYGNAVKITDAYVPSGSNSFAVADASGFAVGDAIRITKSVADNWVNYMGMDVLVRDGKKETWVKGDLTTDRTIQKIEGNKITLDIPLSDSFDAQFTGAGTMVSKIGITGEVSQLGVENLKLVCPEQSVAITDGHFGGISMRGISDSWVKNVEIVNTVGAVDVNAQRITVTDVTVSHAQPTKGAAKPADLVFSGSQILFNRCNITGDQVFYVATQAKVTGPFVVLNCVFKGLGWIQPHQRWATGLLIDGCQVPGGGIDFMNRGEMGSGHGWAIAWAVAWNCKAKSYLNQLPPGAANWVIGSKGEHDRKPMPFEKNGPDLPEGIYDSHDKPVTPASLYLSQLAERLGPQAVKNIGY